MVINNINITTMGATLIDRNFTNHEVINVNEWLEGSPSPLFLRSYDRYKNMELVFLLEAASDEAMFNNMDTLVRHLKMATFKFDDITHLYDAHMEGAAAMEKLTNGKFKISVSLLVRRTYLPEVAVAANALSAKSITNAGSVETPIKLVIVPTGNLVTYTITGLTKESLVLKNLLVGNTYTVDGYNFKYTKNADNDIANFSSFEFPKLAIGQTTVGFSSTAANVTINYFPQFN